MLTQFADTTHSIAPPRPSGAACVFLSDELPAELNIEATLAQAVAKCLNNVPGWHFWNPADCCRTWICNCTRAVPHGSFL